MRKFVVVVVLTICAIALVAPWSAQAGKLAYISRVNQRPCIYVYDFTTRENTPVTIPGEGYYLNWSPDGRTLLISYCQRSKDYICQATKSASGKYDIKPLAAGAYANYLDDGSVIFTRGKTASSVIMQTSGKTQKLFEVDFAIPKLIVSSASNSLMYYELNYSDTRLTTYDLEKRRVSRSYPIASNAISPPSDIVWSPDGKRVLVVYPMAASAVVYEGYILNLATGKQPLAVHFEFEGMFTWETNGTLLCFQSSSPSSSLSRFDLATKSYQKITSLPGYVTNFAYTAK